MKQLSFLELIFCTACLLLFAGCDRNRIMEENQPVTGNQWNYTESKTFTANISDTTQHYNLYVQLRHAFNFEWRNVWVNIETVFPDGKKLQQRVNLVLSEPDGHWYGNCQGDNCDMQVPIQQNAIFPLQGKYSFKITQDMRVNPLPLVKSVGMRIEKVSR